MHTKRSVVQWEGGMTIIESTLPPSGEMVAAVTSVNLARGKSTSVALDGRCIRALLAHRMGLLRQRRRQTAREARERERRRRLKDIGEE